MKKAIISMGVMVCICYTLFALCTNVYANNFTLNDNIYKAEMEVVNSLHDEGCVNISYLNTEGYTGNTVSTGTVQITKVSHVLVCDEYASDPIPEPIPDPTPEPEPEPTPEPEPDPIPQPDTVHLAWDAVPNAVTYNLRYRVVGTVDWVYMMVDGTTTFVVIADMEAIVSGQTYEAELSAIDHLGVYSENAELTFVAP